MSPAKGDKVREWNVAAGHELPSALMKQNFLTNAAGETRPRGHVHICLGSGNFLSGGVRLEAGLGGHANPFSEYSESLKAPLRQKCIRRFFNSQNFAQHQILCREFSQQKTRVLSRAFKSITFLSKFFRFF